MSLPGASPARNIIPFSKRSASELRMSYTAARTAKRVYGCRHTIP